MRPPRARRRPSPLISLFLTVLFIAFLVGGGYSGYLFYITVKDVVAHAQFPSIPNLRLPAVSRSEGPPVERRDLPNWERKERVNILLLGVDRREDETGPSRTDTIIVATIDPETKTAGMLSIPRDLWVTIPGYGENRINTANYLGDRDKYPGGGPALAKKTVQYNLGIPIHYYVRIDFAGFEKIIDTIGGIDIYVEKTIDDATYPDENYGYDPFYIEAGQHHLDGKTALKYARTRHGTGDFDRARRQQQVLFAVREQALRLNLLPKVPELLVTLGDAVQTDLQPGEILALAQLGNEIDINNVKTAVIDDSMTVDHITPNGAWVLLPIREKIRPVVDEMFTSPVPTPLPVVVVPDETRTRLAQEAAKIVVQNGTPLPGLEATTAEYLSEKGYNVVQFGLADREDYPKTVIIDYTGKTFTLESLVDLFHVEPENIRRSANLKSEVDVRIIVGQDFQLPPAE